jgi:hypothetical protein
MPLPRRYAARSRARIHEPIRLARDTRATHAGGTDRKRPRSQCLAKGPVDPDAAREESNRQLRDLPAVQSSTVIVEGRCCLTP